MKIIKGDLIQFAQEGKFDVIVHGCNCFCQMDAGIAKTIKEKFPEAYEVDCMTQEGDKNKLGTISTAVVCRGVKELVIVNAYTQYHWSSYVRQVDYAAVRDAFKQIKNSFSGRRIGYPKIGAGLAGGDWRVISPIIDEELAGEEHYLVLYASEGSAH